MFNTERTSYKQNFPFPENGETVYETPPTLIWVPSGKKYTVRVWNENGDTVFEAETELNHVYDKEKVWESGKYFWDIENEAGDRRGVYSFDISPDAVTFIRPEPEKIFENVPLCHPRDLFTPELIPEIVRTHATELKTLENNVKIALAHGLPDRPEYHRGENAGVGYREYFGSYRDYCDRDMVACALKYALLGDPVAGEHAKELLFTICDMNSDGPCSLLGPWGDEVGLSNARCLPAVFDMLCPLLDAKQRKYAALSVAKYARQCQIAIDRVNYNENPSNSHCGRLPAYLGEAAIVLKGEGVESDETLTGWLKTATDIYGGIFPFYGSADGSWAEGAFYSTSYTKWYLPFFSAAARYGGSDYLVRPFYQRYTQFLLHFCDPEYELHPFGDGYWCGSADAEWPGFFAQDPYRVYAEKYGPDEAVKRFEKYAEQPYYMLHLLDVFLPKPEKCGKTLTGEAEDAAVFRDGGFVALHSDLRSKDDICVMARASRFGSDSHRHPDQGSFAIFAGGKALICPSGYFGRQYGSRHHAEWTNSTIAHNALLFDGKGQKPNSISSVGRIVSFDKKNKSCLLDLSAAYDNVTRWERSISLNKNEIVITDRVLSENETEVLYPLHTLSEPAAEGNTVTVIRGGAKLTVIPERGELTLAQITDKYGVDLNEGVPERFRVTMPAQYHIYYKSPKKKEHFIQVRYRTEFF